MPRTPMGGLSSGWWKGARTRGTGNVQLGGLSGTRGVVQVDASDLIKIGGRITTMAALAGPAIEVMLDAAARARLGALKKATPYQRRGDRRYPVHLRNSYVITATSGKRTISTLEARKFNFVVQGTSAHVIKPRFKKALYWPGIEGGRPVAVVWNHLGTPAQDIVGNSDGIYRAKGNRMMFTVGVAAPGSTFTPGGTAVTGDTAFASSIADAIVAGIAGIFLPVGLLLSLIAIPFAELMEWADKEKKD